MFTAANTAHTNATPADSPSLLFWIIEALLMVNLRDEVAAENPAAEAGGAYHYGL